MKPPETPAAFGTALFTADLKSRPDDFQVNEIFDIELEGSGEHLFLQVEKIGLNTADVLEMLQSAYSLGSKDIGLSGLKDRQAVTRQWFSVHTPQNADLAKAAFAQHTSSAQQVSVLSANRHSRKLRRGAHKGNAFAILLRNVTLEDENTPGNEAIDQRLAQIAERGFPNYLGPQRFGFNGQNLVRAQQWFRKPRKRTSRQQRSLWLSAVRSALFNEVCAARVRAGSWDSLLVGEPAVLDGSRSFFDTSTSEASDLKKRLDTFDIHPSAPWWGRGKALALAECAELEAQVLADYRDMCEGLEKAGLTQERRAIRALAQELSHEWLDNQTLKLTFSLSPGIFATTLLAQLGACKEPERGL